MPTSFRPRDYLPPVAPVRYRAIDGLRFIAAMGVVAHHYTGLAGSPFLETLFAKNYLFVDFFFAISGFVIFHTYADRMTSLAAYGDFLKNRIARVYPLHLFTLLLFALLAATLWRAKPDRGFVDPQAFIPNLLMIHAWGTTSLTAFNYPSWSISAEWFAYLLFPAVVLLLRRAGALATLLVALAIVAGLETAVHRGLIEPWTTLTWHFGALRVLPTFLAGAALAHAIDRLPLRIDGFGPAWALFAGSFLAMAAGLDDRLIVLSLLACLVATAVAERDGATGLLTRRVMAGLGDLSYAIYMIHPLIGMVFIGFVGGKLLHLTGSPLVAWAAFCAFVPNLVVSWFLFHGFETPARRFVRDFRWRLEPRAVRLPAAQK